MANKVTLLTTSVALAAGLALSAPVIAAGFMDCDLVPYVGADAQWRQMGYKQNFGKNVTKKNYPQGNVYAGLSFNEYVGAEIGYEFAKTLKRNVTLQVDTNTQVFGNLVTGIPGSLSYNTKSSISAFHASLIGFLPLSEEYCLKLFGALGIAQTNAKVTSTLLPSTLLGAGSTFSAKQKKWVPRVSLGLQHTFCEQIGVRLSGTWEKTSSLKKMTGVFTGGTLQRTAKLKDSFILGLGLFYNFK